LAQAEVPIAAVTGSVEWDYLLSLIQAKIEKLELALASMEEGHTLDADFSYESMVRQKVFMLQFRIQKDTLEKVRDLPKQIIEQGEKAKLALHEYTDD